MNGCLDEASWKIISAIQFTTLVAELMQRKCVIFGSLFLFVVWGVSFIQQFDTAGWVTRRATGLQKFASIIPIGSLLCGPTIPEVFMKRRPVTCIQKLNVSGFQISAFSIFCKCSAMKLPVLLSVLCSILTVVSGV